MNEIHELTPLTAYADEPDEAYGDMVPMPEPIPDRHLDVLTAIARNLSALTAAVERIAGQASIPRPPLNTDVMGTVTAAPLTRQHFAQILAETGNDPITGFVKWGLEPFESMSDEQKRAKIAAIRAAQNVESRVVPAQPYAQVAQVIAQAHPADDIMHCWLCTKPGKVITMRDGSTFMSCIDAECRMRNGKHTTWDAANWAKRRQSVTR